jgi:tRNA(Arg) A34 adenosine deaminase TadA
MVEQLGPHYTNPAARGNVSLWCLECATLKAQASRPWEGQPMVNEFMERAIALAIENVNSGRGGPFGAILVKNGRVIASGTNRVTSTNDPTAHAEMLAIREACRVLRDFQLTGCDLYTSCEPCPMCFGAIYWARLARVFFGATAQDASAAGFDDSFIYEELRRSLPERKISTRQIMRDQALATFDAWRQKPDRTNY